MKPSSHCKRGAGRPLPAAAAMAAAAFGLAVLADASAPASAQHHNHGAGGATAAACTQPTLACATAATPAFDKDGRLWLVWTAASKVWVAHAAEPGGPLGPAVAVTPAPLRIDSGPDARPKIAVDANGRTAVAFAVVPEGGWNGQIFTSASTDGGKTFSPPRRIDPASPGHRFEALLFLPTGELLAAAIDKTNAVAAKKTGTRYAGAALTVAWSGDGGATFSAPKAAVDQSCECCRVALAIDPSGRAVIAFRNVFGGTTRDHAVITAAPDGTTGPVRRISRDEWVTDACPHQGPALAITKSGTYHVAWFTGGTVRKGLFYARSTNTGETFSEPRKLGRDGVQASRPQVATSPQGVVLAWKEFDGETTSIVTQSSADDGATWTTPRVIASTKRRADHPQLVTNPSGTVFLSWLTDEHGHQLLPVGGTP